MNALIALPPVQAHARALPALRVQVKRREAFSVRCHGAWNLQRHAAVREVGKVVQENMPPSRFVQLRRGQKAAAAAAFLASIAGLLHLVLRALSPHDARSWLFGRPRHQEAEGLVALSNFLSAHPIEFPGLLWASSAATGACEAAARVGCSGNYRTLYVSLMLAGLCYLFDESAVAQQIKALATPGPSSAVFFAAYLVYMGLDWLSNGVSISEVFVGLRSTRKFGFPRPWRPAKSRLLPKLYGIAEGMCLLEMSRSTLWRLGRLLPVLAALDELRRVSVDPHNLSSPEAAQLNKGAGFWAWASLLEAALLGVVCASWARHLGCGGASAVITGMLASLVAALPAAVVLAVTFYGWYRSDLALTELTKAKPLHPPEQLGRYNLDLLEKCYTHGIANFYRSFYARSSASSAFQVPMELNDYEYYRLKVRLTTAGSPVVRLSRDDIRQILAEVLMMNLLNWEAKDAQARQEPPDQDVPASQKKEPLGKDDDVPQQQEPVGQDVPASQKQEPVGEARTP
ncbi:unnamed protein product [Cladocopium goreaui]|uniref:PDZ domain-containing protein n=1 Tax=Cladocopium goreaui TaxID=2562237 RepID=A0A9P1FXL5_9DINO|nr:unnamed protein product [Cladocopium goreaui]